LITVVDTPEDAREYVFHAMQEGGWLKEKEEAARDVTRKVFQK